MAGLFHKKSDPVGGLIKIEVVGWRAKDLYRMEIDRTNDKKQQALPKPPWLKLKLPNRPNYEQTRQFIKDGCLHTVCQEVFFNKW